MNDHEKELDKLVKEKIAELSLAHYQGGVKQVLLIWLDEKGMLQSMRAYDNHAMPHFYLCLGILQREIEAALVKNATPMQPRE